MRTRPVKIIALEAGATIIFQNKQRIVAVKPRLVRTRDNLYRFALFRAGRTGPVEWFTVNGHDSVEMVMDVMGVLTLIGTDKDAAMQELKNVIGNF